MNTIRKFFEWLLGKSEYVDQPVWPTPYPNTSGFYPDGPRLLVKPDPIEETTQSGIIIAKDLIAKEANAQIQGVLVAIGPGAWIDNPVDRWADQGDHVLFGKYSGLYYKGLDGENYRIINDEDLVGHTDVAVSDSANTPSRKNYYGKRD